MPAIWDHSWGYLTKQNIAPIMVGEFGSNLQTSSDQQWFQAFQAYMKQNALGWTFWSLNPDSGDTGGLLADDWKTVVQAKQDVLKLLQYPFIGTGGTVAATSTPAKTATSPAPASTLLLSNFESGTTSGWAAFKDAATTVAPSIVSPGAVGNHAMKVKYSLSPSGYGGVQQAFTAPHNWSSYARFEFRFYGTNTGHTIRLELMDNRAPGSTTDTSERFEYLFKDSFTGWRSISLPWSRFTRRISWQPTGAPNNGLTRTQVWGYSFAPLNGSGTFEIDQVSIANSGPCWRRLSGLRTLSAGTHSARACGPRAGLSRTRVPLPCRF